METANRAQLLAEWPHLIPSPNEYPGSKEAAQNIRIELKKAFGKEYQGVKFSVRSEQRSIRISWTDGPSKTGVEAIVKKYETGVYDMEADYHTSEHSEFTLIFGGANFVSIYRKVSDALKFEICKIMAPKHQEANMTAEGLLAAINDGRIQWGYHFFREFHQRLDEAGTNDFPNLFAQHEDVVLMAAMAAPHADAKPTLRM